MEDRKYKLKVPTPKALRTYRKHDLLDFQGGELSIARNTFAIFADVERLQEILEVTFNEDWPDQDRLWDEVNIPRLNQGIHLFFRQLSEQPKDKPKLALKTPTPRGMKVYQELNILKFEASELEMTDNIFQIFCNNEGLAKLLKVTFRKDFQDQNIDDVDLGQITQGMNSFLAESGKYLNTSQK